MFFDRFGCEKEFIDGLVDGPIESFNITHLDLTLRSEHCLETTATLCYKTCNREKTPTIFRTENPYFMGLWLSNKKMLPQTTKRRKTN